MPFLLTTVNTASEPAVFFPTILISFLLIFSNYGTSTSAQTKITTIGAIIDDNTRIGREVKAAMKVAIQIFNSSTVDHKVSLHFRNPGAGNPLQSAYAAEELIKEMNVKAIIGMETWEETTLVSEIGNRAQVPVISFASAAITQPIMPQRWPFLIQMASHFTEQIICIKSIVRSFNWKKVIAIYEVDYYGSDSGMFAVLSDSLQDIGVEIEYGLILPPFSSLVDPKVTIRERLAELLSKQSRVFIVLKLSLSMTAHLFREAKQMKLNGKDSAWIIAEPIASLLDSVNTSVISSMEGALGIKTYYTEDSKSFLDFKSQFRRIFQSEYPDEDNTEMGISALRAFDSINATIRAIERISNSSNDSTTLLPSILSSDFTGLSGDIRFHGGDLAGSALFRIVNVVGKRYKDLGFWSSTLGFSETIDTEETGRDSMELFAGLVNWPGNLKRVPKGWSMPTDTKPLKIGVPGRTTFHKFVKVDWNASSLNESSFSGFCIDVFSEVLHLLKQRYPLRHEFVPYNGTYNDLVDHVANKTFDAVIGDVTILANRSKYVQFTQPYTESTLSLIVTVKSQHGNAWIFVKPFTKKLWAMTGAIFIYTVFFIWLLERQSNPEFEGPWLNQLSMALWFTSSSLFFVQRDKVHNSYTRAVVVVWLFVVLALTSSYTASLSSMLTVQRLQPSVTDIEWLLKKNATVACDIDSFIGKYLEDVLKFDPRSIKGIENEYVYTGEFESGNISAAFLELPYAKAFLKTYCKGYTLSAPTDEVGHRFGGLGFVFQKGSPLADDFSQAFLTLSENGRLEQLEVKWFHPSPSCLNSQTFDQINSLSWESFWGLYLFSACTSSICFLLFASRQLYERHYHSNYGDIALNTTNTLIKLARLVNHIRKTKVSCSSPNTVRELEVYECSSTSTRECPIYLDTPHQFEPSLSIEVDSINVIEGND